MCLNAVLDSAKCLGRTLSVLINVLNCQTVVIAGEVSRFGKHYLDAINQFLSCNLGADYHVRAEFSTLQNSTILGAKIKGADLAIQSNLRETN